MRVQRVQPWMLRALALTWSPVVLLVLLVLRLFALDTAFLGLPLCVPFLLILIALFLATMKTTRGRLGMVTPPAFNLYTLLVLLPCNDVYVLLSRGDNSTPVVVALAAHFINTLTMVGGLVCLHLGLMKGVWQCVRMYLALVAVVVTCADLLLYHITAGAAVEYPSPGGVDTLRSSLFTVAVALTAATVSAPSLRELFLTKWTAVPLSSIPVEATQLDPRSAPSVRWALSASASEEGAATEIASTGLPGSARAEGAAGAAGAGCAGAACGGGSIGRSPNGAASSRCSDESNSEIQEMTTGLAEQRSAGEGLIGHAREAGRDPEWDGPGFLPAGSSRASSRSSSHTCSNRADSRGAGSQRSESRGGGAGSERGEAAAVPSATLEHRSNGGRRAAK